MQHSSRRSDFHYHLPETLIARYPLANRSDSRLLVASAKSRTEVAITDSVVKAFADYLCPKDLIVTNNTRVLPARLHAVKQSGGKVEILVERMITAQRVRAYLRATRAPKTGSTLLLGKDTVRVTERCGALFTLASDRSWQELMAMQGEMPIPPYLARKAEARDSERYQTIYAQTSGAVAAPTAGLHFDHALLDRIAAKGVARVNITLHVGAGTFEPVREEDLNAHMMHEEWFSVGQDAVAAIAACRARGGRVVAIGTTSLRALESVAHAGIVKAGSGDTDLFISPGYQFQCVDALFTNFHLPESTLIMLVSAFAGLDNIRRIYHHAIDQRYRFYSYGDAMFLTHRLDKI